jgi:hypothetical protein
VSMMRISIEAPAFGVFNAERFKRYGLLLAYRVHDAAEAVIERLEEDGDAKAERSKHR